MKLSLGVNQFFDDDGTPLDAGRITVHAHDSDTALDIYTLEGDEYVLSDNPLLTSNDGRVPGLYFEAQVVDVVVEKQNLDGTFETLDTYNAGYSLAQAKVETRVDTVSELDSVDPAATQAVTVLGFYRAGDCPERTYVWDPNLTQSADGGYLRSSNVDSNGRWVLLWGCDVLPASVYGVIPGQHEENLVKLLGYPTSVGSFHEATARTIRFTSGTYTTTVALSTDKVVLADPGVVFMSNRISCDSLRIDQDVTGPVGKFYFRNADARACLSWFSSLEVFLRCGARVLEFNDASREFELSENVIVTDKILVGCGDTVAITGEMSLTFTNCTWQPVGGTPVLSHEGQVVLNNCTVSDRDIQADNVVCNSCHLDIASFDSADTYVAWARSNGATVLDLQGRGIGTLASTNGFDIVRNGSATVLNVTSNVTLQDMTISTLKPDSSNSTVTMSGCHVNTVYAQYPNWTYSISDSSIYGDLPFRSLSARGSSFAGLVQKFGEVGSCSIVDCKVSGDITTSNFSAQGCTLLGTVWTREYSDTITCSFIGCDIVGTQVIRPGEDSEGTVKVNGAWTGNRWLGQFLTVQHRYDDADNTDYLSSSSAQHTWMYVGNTGNCLQEFNQATTLKVQRRQQDKPAEHWGALSYQLHVFGFGLDIPGEFRLVDHIGQSSPVDSTGRDWAITVPREDSSYATSIMRDSVSDYWSARIRESYTVQESGTAVDETVTAYVTFSKFGTV